MKRNAGRRGQGDSSAAGASLDLEPLKKESHPKVAIPAYLT